MTSNVCGKERKRRGVVSVLMIILALVVGEIFGLVIGIIGAVILLTAIFSYCPMNALAHRNSCRPSLRDPLRSRESTNVNY